MFCSKYLIPAFENVGLSGFTAYALAFIEPAAARFAETHGKSSWPDVAGYIAERVALFIEEKGIDVEAQPQRLLSARGGYLRSPELLSVFDGMSLRFKRPEPEPAPEPEPDRQPDTDIDWEKLHKRHTLPPLAVSPSGRRGGSRTQRPGQIWDAALGELQLQVARPAFETWLRDTDGVGYDDGEFIVGTANDFISEMLEHRMYPLIERAVEHVLNEPVRVRFQVVTQGARADECPLCKEEEL